MKVVIDGNIGSGKTTQLGLLEKAGYIVRREPIDQWPLEEFYIKTRNVGHSIFI
jgi:predicted ATPase